MPPKFKFTKEEILSVALDITRLKGINGLTARSLAEKLGTSAKPIFGQFQNMEDLQKHVLDAAHARYLAYQSDALTDLRYPPYKASGMAYIAFAREEKELFKILFMRDRTGETIGENREEIRPILEILKANLQLSEEDAYLFHMESWIYVHGIATMVATNYLDWDMEFISNALTDFYQGLKLHYARRNQNGCYSDKKLNKSL